MQITIDKNFYDWRNNGWKDGSIEQGADLFGRWIKKSIKDKYSPIAEVIFYNSWVDYAKHFTNYQKSKNILFRGQSNSGNGNNINFWQIQSILNRNYPEISLEDFYTIMANGKRNVFDYPIFKEKIQNKTNLQIIDLLSFLQHRSIPTPLVDFTRDPITALFFACSGKPFENVRGTDNRFMSVFEIDCNILTEYGIKEMPNDFKTFSSSGDELIPFNPLTDKFPQVNNRPFVAICNDAYESIENTNYKYQDGAFILLHIPSKMEQVYETSESIKIQSLEDILLYLKATNKLNKLSVKLHLIPYQSVYLNYERRDIWSWPDVLYLYLKLKGKTGKELFANDDVNGFKYDFMFNSDKVYSQSNFLARMENSEEKNFLIENGLI